MTNVNIRYIVDDVAASIEFYVTHLGFTLEQDARPAILVYDVRLDGVAVVNDAVSDPRGSPNGIAGGAGADAGGRPCAREGRCRSCHDQRTFLAGARSQDR